MYVMRRLSYREVQVSRPFRIPPTTQAARHPPPARARTTSATLGEPAGVGGANETRMCHVRVTTLPLGRNTGARVCVSMPRSVWRHGDPVTLPLWDRGRGITTRAHKTSTRSEWKRRVSGAPVGGLSRALRVCVSVRILLSYCLIEALVTRPHGPSAHGPRALIHCDCFVEAYNINMRAAWEQVVFAQVSARSELQVAERNTSLFLKQNHRLFSISAVKSGW
jgi:hypothetical protein